MTAWTSDELNKIGRAEELEIAPRRRDGTLRNAVTIWVVRLGDDLYVRSYKGRTSAWFRGAQASQEGHIRAGGIDKDVTLVEEAAADMNDQIDAAYRAKYRRYAASIVGSIVSPEARSATIKLVPRSAAAMTASTMRGSCRIASATFVNGPIQTNVNSPGCDMIFSMRKSLPFWAFA